MRGQQLLLLFVALTGGLTGATVSEPLTGITLRVDRAGQYSITAQNPDWTFAGDIGRPLMNLTLAAGTDTLGDYDEIIFQYVEGVLRQAGIRTYRNKPAVLFTVKYFDAARNTEPFPKLSDYPRNPYDLSYEGIFGIARFHHLSFDSPWISFDSGGNTFMLSPASNFMVAATTRGDNLEISSGIHSRIATLPAGFTHQTILVVERGINKAFETWGGVMTELQGKSRPANDADKSLAYLGYWTDAGATYYYSFEPALGYEGTLLALRDEFLQKGTPLAYMQLDSWFYPKGASVDWKNTSAGIYRYEADHTLFPQGLKGFQQRLGLPLITHARWIDANSPYRNQYRISGNVATDARYWSQIAGYLRDAAVVTYEQDWLGAQAQADFNLSDPEAFMTNMAKATGEQGLTMQYCMALPRHYLQSTKYANVTSIRTSPDRFTSDRWDQFLYGSRLASALGLWPWADVFMSAETSNVLLATLSAGPVGVGDKLGTVNRQNLLRAIRADGMIVKPDAPVAPIDDSYLNDAQSVTRPMIASTYSDFGRWKALYIFAYARGLDKDVTFTPGRLGMSGQVYVYNYVAQTGRLMHATETVHDMLTDEYAYYVIVPVNDSGIGFLGDAGQFVGHGKKRISDVGGTDAVRATILFAAGESTRTLHGYAPSAPVVIAQKGVAGEVAYDPDRQLFRVNVSPDADGSAMIVMKLPGFDRARARSDFSGPRRHRRPR